jgi:uncharacterized protein (DUF2267 family)
MTNPRDVKYANESIARWQEVLKDRTFAVTNNITFAMLRAWLHEVRARLSIPEIAKFGNALPAVQRGVFYQDWNPEHPRLDTPSLEEFEAALAQRLLPHVHMPDGLAADMIYVLKHELADFDRETVRAVLPEPLAKVWDRA